VVIRVLSNSHHVFEKDLTDLTGWAAEANAAVLQIAQNRRRWCDAAIRRTAEAVAGTD
jgi:hypothetical protein